MPGPRKIVAVLDDLMFRVKINETAKRSGFETSFVKTEADVMALAKEGPVLIILDLNCNSVETVDVAVKLKAEFKAIPLIAFVSHVQGELKQKAQEAGIDMVLARSAFSQNLPQLLKRYSGTY